MLVETLSNPAANRLATVRDSESESEKSKKERGTIDSDVERSTRQGNGKGEREGDELIYLHRCAMKISLLAVAFHIRSTSRVFLSRRKPNILI